ncbi:ATP-binding domain-containing protein [Ancylomarina sp. DW003]|nr:3'-5' exonuclease [Ancylomarina sp. DW003]MDE5421517.1 ATP-binding domain-containing protein [Ancylomarina sp. DW003]
MRLDNWFITNPDTSQQEVLKVPVKHSLTVKGAAGSGKTNMAIYRANQARDNSFVIVVYTVALKKMIRYGLSELGLDKDRVVHEWSWINRGIEFSGDVFCLKGNNAHGLNPSLLFIKSGNEILFFVSRDEYDSIVKKESFLSYNIQSIENPFEVSIDFDDWIEDKFYYTFYRRSRWFKQVQLLDFHFDPNDKKYVFIPAGYLFKEKGEVNYVIVDEGQDFTLSNYSQQFIPQAKKSISIFGDTNQKIYKDRNCNIEDVATRFNYPMLNLNFNYRVPKTIARVAQNIPLPHLDLLSNNRKNNGNSDYPSFPKPILKRCNSEEEELQYILNRIQTEGLDDVAILLPKEETVKELHKFFSDNNVGTQVRIAVDTGSTPLGNRKFHRIDTLDFTNLDLPSILTYHSAKGTEFDNVFIPFANEDNGLERNPFYVAITRSSSRVFITYSRKLTSLLKDVSSNDVIFQ